MSGDERPVREDFDSWGAHHDALVAWTAADAVNGRRCLRCGTVGGRAGGCPLSLDGDHHYPDLAPSPSIPDPSDERRRFFLDTEFIEDGERIHPLAVAIVTEDGDAMYAVLTDTDRSLAGEWVTEHVLPYLDHQPEGATCTRGNQRHVARFIREWVAERSSTPEFWADYGAYDWVLLCQLFGTMLDLPDGWPMFVRDIQQIRNGETLPDPEHEHQAVSDALNARDRWRTLAAARPTSLPEAPSDKDATDGTDGRPDPVRTRREGRGDGTAEGAGSAADPARSVAQSEVDQEVADPVYGVGTAAHLREWIAAPDLGLRYSAYDFKRTVAALLDALDLAASLPEAPEPRRHARGCSNNAGREGMGTCLLHCSCWCHEPATPSAPPVAVDPEGPATPLKPEERYEVRAVAQDLYAIAVGSQTSAWDSVFYDRLVAAQARLLPIANGDPAALQALRDRWTPPAVDLEAGAGA